MFRRLLLKLGGGDAMRDQRAAEAMQRRQVVERQHKLEVELRRRAIRRDAIAAELRALGRR